MAHHDATKYFPFFFDACQTILSSRSLGEMLRHLVKRTVRALDVKAGSLWLVDRETHRLELVASHLLSQKFLNKGPLSADRSIPEVLEGKAVVIRDAFRDPRVQYRSEMLAEGINTVLAVPVVARDEVIGVLRVYTKEPREFSEEEIEFASALAEVGGLAVANARIQVREGIRLSSLLRGVGVDLPKETRRIKQRFRAFALKPLSPSQSLEQFRALHEVTLSMLSTLDSRKVVELIIERVLSLMRVNGVTLRLVNDTTGELELVASQGLSDRFLSKGPVHSDRSIREALEGVPVLVADATRDPRVEYPSEVAREGISSILSVPIIAQERVIGVLRAYSAEKREYGREEVAFLSALAATAGIAIANARLYEKTQYDLSFWQATLDYFDLGEKRGG
jgi:GAF domain-containing protein